MTDRRRKRKTTNSFADDTVKDFSAVDPVQARRRSDCSDHEGGARHESWMSKVSLAMSTRIFSGKKLSGSRSTQVMPIGAAVSDTSKTSAGRVSSASVCSLQEADLQHVPSPPTSVQQTLRLVASEKTLGSSTDPSSTSSPVTSLEACPSVTCDVASDDSDETLHDDDNGPRWSSHGSASRRRETHRRGNTRRQASSTVVQKVRPGDESDEDDMTVSPARSGLPSTGGMRPRDAREYADGEANVQDAAPILKGFFSRNMSVSKELRDQQREQRRENFYRESKQRQDKLREQTERERLASEGSRRREKVEQLRRLNQQRRKELLRDAASARKDLLEHIQQDNDAYQAQRESWETDFEDEMRVLSQAFRKARASDEARPMTVAGLAVPEAISQLERDASNFEKRVKTAQPALATMPLHQRRAERPNTSGATPSMSDLASSPFFESCEVLALEDSKDVFDLFGGDDQAGDLFPLQDRHPIADDAQEPDLDLDQLLGEREKLLQRVAAIDRIVQSQQQ
jgi:hypothetical protein